MANVFFVEGWGLPALFEDFADPTVPETLARLGWRGEFGASYHADNRLALVETETLGRAFRMSSLSETSTNFGGRIFRVVAQNQAEVVLGFAVDPELVGGASPTNGYALAWGASPATPSADTLSALTLPDGQIQIRDRTNTTPIIAIPVTESPLIPGFSNWVEVIVNATTREVELWVNNAFVAAGLRAIASSAIDYCHLAIGSRSDSLFGWGSNTTRVIGSLYVADERLGRCQVITRHPTDDESVEFSRPQGDSNASQVADRDGPDGDATYVSSSTTGVTDFYSSDDPVPLTNERIHAVAVSVSGRREDVGMRTLAPVIRQGSSVAQGAPTELPIDSYSGTQTAFSVDPATGNIWTVGGVNSHQFGARLVE